jgi:hypothetical protein
LLYTSIGYVAPPRLSEKGGGILARVELPERSVGPKAMFLSGDAIRHYFYALTDTKTPRNLYTLLGVCEAATPADLRMAWHVCQLESGAKATKPSERLWAERALNILSHADLRKCYDTLRREEDAPPVFPYGGFGSILVQGNLSNDGEAIFADRILAYKPEMQSRKVSLLPRQCDFRADRAICGDPRRKLEVMLDSGLLPGIDWDITWNHWKHWLQSRISMLTQRLFELGSKANGFCGHGLRRFRRGSLNAVNAVTARTLCHASC